MGQLSGFTLLFEALVLMLAQQMPFAAVARAVNLSWHRVHAICSRYVELAIAAADLSGVTAVAIDGKRSIWHTGLIELCGGGFALNASC